MDLFGAATMGVDPKTGSYLSKEQRVAMFRASRGQGGSGGGASSNGNRAQVAPQNSIVVANKFSQITQTLNSNYQQATQGVAEQVAQNKRDISNIYRIIAEQRKSTLENEKQETRDLQIETERNRRSLREKFIEGISAAAAAAAVPLQKIGKAVGDKARGFLSRITQFLSALAAAWAIDNLPLLIKKFDEYFGNLDKFKSTVFNSITKLRGVFTIFDVILRRLLKFVKDIAKFAFKISSAILRSSFRVARSVFNGVRNFVSKILSSVIPKLKKFIGDVVKKVTSLLPKQQVGNFIKRAVRGGSELIRKGVNAVGKVLPKPISEFLSSGAKGLSNAASAIGKSLSEVGGNAMQGIKSIAQKAGAVLGDTSARKKWLDKAMSPLTKLKALKGLGGKLSKLTSLLSRFPGIGFAIDLAINRGVDGDGWTQAILQSLFSAGAGVLGGKAGLALGAKVGGGIGLLAGGIGALPGAAIGGGIGWFLGSTLAGYLGDRIGNFSYEQLFSEDKPLSSMGSAIDENVESAAINLNKGLSEIGLDVPKIDISKSLSSITGGMSTPEGMQMSESETESRVSVTEMPPIMETQETEKPKETIPNQEVPFLPTSNPMTEMYRRYSMSEFDMTLEGAFG